MAVATAFVAGIVAVLGVVAADTAVGIAVGTAVLETGQGFVSLDCTGCGRRVAVRGPMPTDVQPSTAVRSSPATADAPSDLVRT